MRAAVGDVVPRRLPFSDAERAPVATGRLEDSQREQVHVRNRERLGLRRRRGEVGRRLQHSEEVRLLEDYAGRVGGCLAKLVGIGHAVPVRHLNHLEAEAGRVGLHDLPHLRAGRLRHDDLGAARRVLRDEAGVGRDGRPVVAGGVGDVQAGELADRGLVLEDRLQDPLAQLGLIRGVRGEELAALQDGVDDRGHVVVVQARAQEGDLGRRALVRGRELLEVSGQLLLRQGRWELQLAIEPHARRQVGKELLDRRDADLFEHRVAIRVGQREVAHSWSARCRR